jgi:hypothetical protein
MCALIIVRLRVQRLNQKRLHPSPSLTTATTTTTIIMHAITAKHCYNRVLEKKTSKKEYTFLLLLLYHTMIVEFKPANLMTTLQSAAASDLAWHH